MVTYLTPGVYVEEVPPQARPISGVGTSTAAFIGVVPDGTELPSKPDPSAPDYALAQADVPTAITSWQQYTTNFGIFTDASAVLAHAVFGFFANGGSRCYVMRVVSADDLADVATLVELLEPYEDISIVAVPGATDSATHAALIAHCETMQDRIAVLDGGSPDALDTGNLGNVRPVGQSSSGSFAALYYPWLRVQGPAPTIQEVAPSGYVAGVYARVDANRGVFKAPANEVVQLALDTSIRVSRAQQDVLNPAGINVLRVFDGVTKVWGARTLADSSAAEFTYVSARRYMNYLRDSIRAGTDWVVFEPNSPALWQRIIRSVGDFLLNEWNSGALVGTKASEAFFVRCDATTNPPEVQDLGRVVTVIGVALARPAEFVIFQVQQTAGS